SIEGLMHHFKIIMEGIHVPPGENYSAVEGGNGELGFYIVSDGGGKPYRVRVRPPCFIAMGAFHEMIKGYMVADIVPTFGMVNMIGGEGDRGRGDGGVEDGRWTKPARDKAIFYLSSSIVSSKKYGLRGFARDIQEVRSDDESLSKERSRAAAGALSRPTGIWPSRTRSDRICCAAHGPA